ncbi:MAG TPA: helix-turn-helix domain-containing protein [Candidatus Methanoperedens sp.]
MGNEEIIELLANKHARAIFSLTSIKECSATQLSQELDIPIATVYRNLKLLETAGLIQHVKTIINLQGNEERYFRCAISEATIRINEGILSVDIKKEERYYKIIRLWKRLAHPKNKGIEKF